MPAATPAPVTPARASIASRSAVVRSTSSWKLPGSPFSPARLPPVLAAGVSSLPPGLASVAQLLSVAGVPAVPIAGLDRSDMAAADDAREDRFDDARCRGPVRTGAAS